MDAADWEKKKETVEEPRMVRLLHHPKGQPLTAGNTNKRLTGRKAKQKRDDLRQARKIMVKRAKQMKGSDLTAEEIQYGYQRVKELLKAE